MYTRILVPIDGSEAGESGLREAVRIAAGTPAVLVLLHVVDDMPMMVEMASAMNTDQARRRLVAEGEALLARDAQAAQEAGVRAETVLREQHAVAVADAIREEAVQRDCELIVMGTHGRRGFSRLALGSDAELVARQAGVPVMLVRQPHGASAAGRPGA
jgi:nucleotide-binding universal stress UspA family protein